MEFIKKRELLVFLDGIRFLRQGYSLCTIFKKEDQGYGFIYVKELFNLVYCPSLGKFFYNKHVRLPLGVCQNFIGMRYTEQSKTEMEKLRIYDIAEAIEVAQANKEEIEHSKEKILRF